MNFEQRFDLRAICAFCGHDNQLSVAAVSLPDSHVVNCSVCGGAVGRVADLKSLRGAEKVPQAVAG